MGGNTHGVIASQILEDSTEQIGEKGVITKCGSKMVINILHRQVVFLVVHRLMGLWIWRAMYGSGALTGMMKLTMGVVRITIQRDRYMAPPGLFAAVRGASVRTTVVAPLGSAARLRSVTTM